MNRSDTVLWQTSLNDRQCIVLIIQRGYKDVQLHNDYEPTSLHSVSKFLRDNVTSWEFPWELLWTRIYTNIPRWDQITVKRMTQVQWTWHDNISGTVYIRFIYKFLNLCPFDYAAVVGSWKVLPVNRLTTPVGWLKLLQLDVLSRSAIAV